MGCLRRMRAVGLVESENVRWDDAWKAICALFGNGKPASAGVAFPPEGCGDASDPSVAVVEWGPELKPPPGVGATLTFASGGAR